MKNIFISIYILMCFVGYGLDYASMANRFPKHNPLTDRAVCVYSGIMWPVFIPLTGYIDGFKNGWKL
jgi:hypothetical protein